MVNLHLTKSICIWHHFSAWREPLQGQASFVSYRIKCWDFTKGFSVFLVPKSFQTKSRQTICDTTKIAQLKCPCDKKNHFLLFLRFWKCLPNTWLAKFCALIFIQRPFTLSERFGFHNRHCSSSKRTDWTSEGWIQGKVSSKAHQFKISACERSLLYMQSESLKVWKPRTTVPHINSAAHTLIAFLN